MMRSLKKPKTNVPPFILMTDKHLKLALLKLHSKNLDAGLPGREEQSDQLYNFLFQRLKVRKTSDVKRMKIESGQIANIRGTHDNKTIFVCGVPGTGKTATVKYVIGRLELLLKQKTSNINPFKAVFINGQHLASPDKLYTQILYKLTKKNLSSEKAQETLEKLFTFDASHVRKGSKESETKHFNIVVVDELDVLYNDRNRGVFYNLFDWPTSSESNLILIVIANAMDLPERLMPNKIQSRLGWEKLLFESYNSDSLFKIIKTRLGEDLMKKCFADKAVQLATLRIGRSTGDARRILDTCRLALDDAIRTKKAQVTIAMIDQVGSHSLDQQRIDIIKNCTPLELHIFKSILIETAKIGEENVEVLGVYRQFTNKLKRDQFFSRYNIPIVVGLDDFYVILTHLAAIGLIYLESERDVIKKRLFIKDTSDIYKDLIRTLEPNYD